MEITKLIEGLKDCANCGVVAPLACQHKFRCRFRKNELMAEAAEALELYLKKVEEGTE